MSARRPAALDAGVYLEDITKEQLLGLVHLPSAQAAEALKVGYVNVARHPVRTCVVDCCSLAARTVTA